MRVASRFVSIETWNSLNTMAFTKVLFVIIGVVALGGKSAFGGGEETSLDEHPWYVLEYFICGIFLYILMTILAYFVQVGDDSLFEM